MDDLHVVPRFDDSLTYLYTEHTRVDRWETGIALWDEHGIIEVPVASIRLLMLGPGTTVTHAAIEVMAENNCLVVWCGEEMIRFYASGIGGTRSAARVLFQAHLVSHPKAREAVVRRLYSKRFTQPLPPDITIEQLRGMEGQRVRTVYQELSAETGVPWHGRYYDRGRWTRADPINRAISVANSCLYGICHAAILSAGYSPALGFIHTGNQLSFVYDIADLYKTDVSLPVAFRMTAQNPPDLERCVRLAMRDVFRQTRLLDRVIPDIKECLGDNIADESLALYDDDPARPTELWDPNDNPHSQEEAP
jgi:CRISPR-associated protein Cas1